MTLKNRFKRNPQFYYSMSIAATWAGAGSFIVGTRIAQTAGIFPWLLWALGNTLCCIVFGLLADTFPRLRAVAKSRPVQILMGLMCVFQIWVNMNGIYEMLSPTIIGTAAARVIVYIHYNRLPLPPIYGWKDGFVQGTHAWPEREFCKTIDQGYREVYEIDPGIVIGAAAKLPSARHFLEEEGLI